MREIPYFMGRALRRVAGCAVAATVLGKAAADVTAGSPSPACASLTSGHGKVVSVTDSQTLQLDSGERVRLVGALAPEAPAWWKADRPWPPSAAAERALAELVLNHEVKLRVAKSEATHDRHNRLLAQAYIVNDGKETWVQGRMVEGGFALAYSLAGHMACIRALQEREDKARQAGAGLWKNRIFTVFDAGATQALLERRGAYQIVEGRVHAIGHTRNWSFVNFSDDWKSDFTVAIAAGQRRRFEGSHAEPGTLKGKHIRVRGWIERWNGPVIKATHPEQLEVIR